MVYQADNGKIKLGVRLQDETVWLKQQFPYLGHPTAPEIHHQGGTLDDERVKETGGGKYLTNCWHGSWISGSL